MIRLEKFLEDNIKAHSASRKGILKNGKPYLYKTPDTPTVKRNEIKAPTMIRIDNSKLGA